MPNAASHPLHTQGKTMRLSSWGYHADFFVYPALIVACATVTLWHAPLQAVEPSLASVGAGLIAWTALEYALHRWLLHRVPPFNRLHALHHAHPAALIGTPTWLSAPLFLAVWASLALEASTFVAGGLITGLMIGYLAYATVHDAVHHRRAWPGSWLYDAKLRHARHHRAEASSEFGVSSGIWDTILHTTSRPSRWSV
jgi:sterol desaturase/sphingolipid hydroxylase (fatty acid hydroxylase superfamily)